MKKHFHLTMAFAALIVTLAGCSDRPVLPAQLPQEIQVFVQQYFPNQQVSYADKDWDWFGYQYDVMLADGTEINFDTNNAWDKVESRLNPVPAALVPAPIATYVNTNFQAVSIVKIDKERYGYEVELANGLELKFNPQGALMSMDD